MECLVWQLWSWAFTWVEFWPSCGWCGGFCSPAWSCPCC
uniref:Uncharacterized protein n=1 Tax=Anguilla anguilla TaxID=7936 RepID=A0A0E9VAD0_ANGAN